MHITKSFYFVPFRVEVNSLRQIIYNTAAGLKKGRTSVMGELIPSSFISLIERIEKKKAEMKQKKELPIIRKEEFDAMVKENSLQSPRDIQEQMDVRDATVFLRERGIWCKYKLYEIIIVLTNRF